MTPEVLLCYLKTNKLLYVDLFTLSFVFIFVVLYPNGVEYFKLSCYVNTNVTDQFISVTFSSTR